MLRPVRLEGDLGHLAAFRPAGGNALGALQRTAVQQDHVREFGAGAIERIKDAFVIRSPLGRRSAEQY